MSTLGIVGAGAFGVALSKVYPRAVLYSRRRIHGVAHIDNMSAHKCVLVTASAQDTRAVCASLCAMPGCFVVLCAKGLDAESGKCLFEIAESVTKGASVAVMSGPNLSGPISAGLPFSSSIAGSDMNAALEIATVLRSDQATFFATSDRVSVSLAGALKNVLAIACGVARGMNLGENAVAAVVTQGAREILHVIEVKGGSHDVVTTPAFIGDIFLTCSSIESRNNAFGVRLASGQEIDQAHLPEGVFAGRAFARHYKHVNAPLLHQISTMLCDFGLTKNLSRDLFRHVVAR